MSSSVSSRTSKARKKPPLLPGGRLDLRGWGIVAALLAVPLAMMAWRLTSLPGAAELDRWISFSALPHEMRHRTLHLLFAPLGALLVVFVRLTLGIRILGPFRSVLLALAFQVTGVVVGLGFFAMVLCAVVVLRPHIKKLRMPYFGKSTALLATVAVLIVATVLVGLALGITSVERVVYFPVVVLTLTGEAFATTLRREGMRSALWRATATALTALVITAMSTWVLLQDLLITRPESLLMVLAAIILVCETLKLKLFEHLNPRPVKKKRASIANLPPKPDTTTPAPPHESGPIVRPEGVVR
ncbi:MAG: hypothetical protein NTV94_04155 [Planctomycetota bacterium]|nr:hypothetical protein [Planctomycetota bacterium]